MGREYGKGMDFLLCCLLSAYLIVTTRRIRIFAGALLASACLALALSALGWNLTARAFLESLSAINQTVGGVLFALAVALVVVAVEWSGQEKSNFPQKILQVVGVSVFAAIGVWFLVFGFKIFVSVPLSINEEAERAPLLVPKSPGLPSDWEKSPRAPEETKNLLVSMRFSISPRSSPSPAFSVINQSDSIARSIRWNIVLWNTELPDQAVTLPIFTYPIEWIKAHEQSGPVTIFGQPPVQLKEGDRLIGSAAVDCPNCVPKSYILYVIWGRSGWYAETGRRWKGKLVMPADGVSRAGREAYFKEAVGIISENRRIPMAR